MVETDFEKTLVKDLEAMFPDCEIMKLNPQLKQGIPDRIILWKNKWATFECKKSKHERHRPNQDYYVNKMNNMSCSFFIYPENKEEMLRKLFMYFTND